MKTVDRGACEIHLTKTETNSSAFYSVDEQRPFWVDLKKKLFGLFPETIDSNVLLIIIGTEEMFNIWSKCLQYWQKLTTEIVNGP